MPIQVYSISTRGHNMGGTQRCSSKEEAEAIYNKLLDAVTNDKPVCELELGGNKMCARTKDITGFGIMVHMEQTPEERKQMAIERVERDMSYQGECAVDAYPVNKIGYGGGLI